MSVVICGTVIPRSALSPVAVQALTSSTNKPSLEAPSPPPSALVPPPPPPRSSPPTSRNVQNAAIADAPPPPPRHPSRAARPPPATGAPPTGALPADGGSGGPNGAGGGDVVGSDGTQQGKVATAARAAAASKSKKPAPKIATPAPAAPGPSSTGPAAGSGTGPTQESLPPTAWTPLALPSVETKTAAAAAAVAAVAAAAAGAGIGKPGGVSAADLAPYGEAELSTALTVPPERLQRAAAEANPFDDRLLVPADSARRVREVVTRLVSLVDEVESAGNDAEVCVPVHRI